MGQLPGFIYAQQGSRVYVNLFIGSEAVMDLPAGQALRLTQRTEYPWDGGVEFTIEPDSEIAFELRIRILELRSRSIAFEIEFRRDDESIARGAMTTVCCAIRPDSFRSIEIPRDVRDKLETFGVGAK